MSCVIAIAYSVAVVLVENMLLEDVTSVLRGIDFDPVVVTPGVDFKIFHPMDADRCSRELGPDGRVMLFVGRLNPGKGLEYLIVAMKKINERVGNAMLVMVGDGLLVIVSVFLLMSLRK